VAALDKVLDAMVTSGALSMTMGEDEIPYFTTRLGPQPVVKNPLPRAKIIAYLQELCGPTETAALRDTCDVAFDYRDMRVSVGFSTGRLVVDVRPGVRRIEPPARDADGASPATDAAAASGAPGSAGTSSAIPPGEGSPIDVLFREVISRGASDLHLTMAERPRIRLHGEMIPLDQPVLDADTMDRYLKPICPEKNRVEFERCHDTDFAYEVPGLARFRCNYFMDRTGIGGVFRQIPSKIPSIDQLGLPKTITDLCWLSKGFVVVTGPTGSGKSTTLAALVDFMNGSRADHIITIEDPIEFVHQNKRCLINQREVGTHTEGFKRALRAALREDPDIVLVGEMRDLETIAIAIETAETGHLVFGTLHTTTAPSTIDRIIDQFPADRQTQIRIMLSESLKGVIAQTLCKKIGGGRVAAYEILIVNSAVSNLIREGKTFQIPSMLQTQKQLGMCTLNDSLLELVKRHQVKPKEAYIKAVDKQGLLNLFERGGVPFDPARD
jgi:twitching motility protein PilT